jgi:methyl-accepting chemotaxis protein
MFNVNNWRIGAKIFAGFGVVIALLIAVAATSYSQLKFTGGNVDGMARANDRLQNILEVAEAVETMRARFLRYRTSHEQTEIAQFNAAAQEALSRIDANAKVAPTDEARALYASATKFVTAARAGFADFLKADAKQVEDFNKLSVSGGVMSAAAIKLSKAAEAAHDDRVNLTTSRIDNGLASVAILNWRFQAMAGAPGLAPFKGGVQRARDAFDAFAKANGDLASAELRDLRATLDTYETNFNVVGSGVLGLEEIYEKTIRPALVDAKKITDQAKELIIKASEEFEVRAGNTVEAATTVAIALGSAATLLGIFLAWFIGRGISKPIIALVPEMQKLADGNFNIDLPQAGRKDEIGQMADAIGEMAKRVRVTIGNIKNSAREVTNASAEISTSTTDLSQRTEEQAASLEQTSAAMEELSSTVKKNAENAQMANTDANNTRNVADQGGKVVAEAVEAMAKIEDSSRKIGDIIGVIDEIARQTNLLALNAAVEAARAGEAGRGFAVVASEVRSLAQRSSQAAKDIKDLITNSNGQVKDGVALVNKAGASLTEILESIKKVAMGVSDIANASIEQATGIEQINRALNQMDEVTQQNSALVEENAATAKTLSRWRSSRLKKARMPCIRRRPRSRQPRPGQLVRRSRPDLSRATKKTGGSLSRRFYFVTIARSGGAATSNARGRRLFRHDLDGFRLCRRFGSFLARRRFLFLAYRPDARSLGLRRGF